MRREYLFEYLSQQIDNCQNIEELKPFLKHIIPFDTLKSIVQNHLKTSYAQSSKSHPNPPIKTNTPPVISTVAIATPKGQSLVKTKSMRSFYLNCASIVEIFPDALHLKILEYLKEPIVYRSFPTISSTFLSIFSNSPTLYNEVSTPSRTQLIDTLSSFVCWSPEHSILVFLPPHDSLDC